ncbi:MAG: hypothetical protein BWY93_01670 [Euryarchaeota archaeon ADurb.BinA087]|nr:MAG: hypothetical protein BWY93_01670 [Euryarchaeota archaeon ADurb.BinA087]
MLDPAPLDHLCGWIPLEMPGFCSTLIEKLPVLSLSSIARSLDLLFKKPDQPVRDTILEIRSGDAEVDREYPAGKDRLFDEREFRYPEVLRECTLQLNRIIGYHDLADTEPVFPE